MHGSHLTSQPQICWPELDLTVTMYRIKGLLDEQCLSWIPATRRDVVVDTLNATWATTASSSASLIGSNTTRPSKCTTSVSWSSTRSTSVCRRSGTATSPCWRSTATVQSPCALCPSAYRPTTIPTRFYASRPAGAVTSVRACTSLSNSLYTIQPVVKPV